jgi:hypothetical protein
MLDGVAEPVQRPDPWVPAPGEHQLARAPGPDELVIDQVRGHPDEGEIAAPLPDDLVSRGERDEVRESLHRHGVAVPHGPRDRLGQ